jgi:hypothetical protein
MSLILSLLVSSFFLLISALISIFVSLYFIRSSLKIDASYSAGKDTQNSEINSVSKA